MSENPFSDQQVGSYQPSNAIADVVGEREVAEVKAMVFMAKQFPRNEKDAMERILTACKRKSLAEVAIYEYARGGTEISGPSIRLAEAIAQSWGNMVWGIRELDQRHGESTVESYAWDLETNARQVKVFQVPHVRHTKNGSYALTDPRDVYELVANLGARRLRSCILGVIPGDVVDAAKMQCETTMKSKVDLSATGIQGMVQAFAEFGVSKEQLEAFCQCNILAVRASQVVRLGKIYTSLRDGMGKPDDFFKPVIHPAGTKNKQQSQAGADAGTADAGGKPSFGGGGNAEPTQGAASNGAEPTKAAGPSDFEAYLVDEVGEVADDLYIDPLEFLPALQKLITKSDDTRLVLMNNEDAFDEAIELANKLQPPDGGTKLRNWILDAVKRGVETTTATAAALAAEEKKPDAIAVVTAPVERGGKPSWTAYVKLFREALAPQTVMGFPAWLEAQREMLATVPISQRLLAIKDANERGAALGVSLPAWIAELSRPAAKKAENPAVQTGQGPASPSGQASQEPAQATGSGQPSGQNGATGTGPNTDDSWARMMVREIEIAETLDDLKTMTQGQAIQSRMGRFKIERADLFKMIAGAVDERWIALGGEVHG